MVRFVLARTSHQVVAAETSFVVVAVVVAVAAVAASWRLEGLVYLFALEH